MQTSFDSEERIITERTSAGIENVLFVYSALAKDLAGQTDNNPGNYLVQSVSVVGSAAQCNRIDSDLDFFTNCSTNRFR